MRTLRTATLLSQYASFQLLLLFIPVAGRVMECMFVCVKEREGSAEGVIVDSTVLPSMALLKDTLHLLLVRLTHRKTCVLTKS